MMWDGPSRSSLEHFAHVQSRRRNWLPEKVALKCRCSPTNTTRGAVERQVRHCIRQRAAPFANAGAFHLNVDFRCWKDALNVGSAQALTTTSTSLVCVLRRNRVLDYGIRESL